MNGLEEVVGIAEKQSKMEEVMLVALWGWIVFCVLWGFLLVLGFFFKGRSYCCCQQFSQSLIAWFHCAAAASMGCLLVPSLSRAVPLIFSLGSFLLLGWRGERSLEMDCC